MKSAGKYTMKGSIDAFDGERALCVYTSMVAAAPKVPAQDGWKSLTDVQWMNIVNHDHAFDSMSKDDAVHLAVKMTEKKLRELNSPALEGWQPIETAPKSGSANSTNALEAFAEKVSEAFIHYEAYEGSRAHESVLSDALSTIGRAIHELKGEYERRRNLP